MHRRDLLKTVACSALPYVAHLPLSRPLTRVGVQLYTLRELMQRDAQRTLEQVAALGCKEVEFAGYFNHPPRLLRRWLDDAGLTSPSAHLPLDDPQLNLGATLDTSAILGHSYVVLASLPLQERSIDDFKRVAGRLNQIGSLAKARGLLAAYHNHDFEFQPGSERLPYIVLLEETDPSLVAMEMDIYWLTKAGGNPLAYFQKYPGRFHLCHLKDMDRKRRITDVGSGLIDFPGILGARERAGFPSLLHRA